MGSLARERRDDGIEVLRLDRPQARNALGSAQLAELEAALADLAARRRPAGARAVDDGRPRRSAPAPTSPRRSTARRRWPGWRPSRGSTRPSTPSGCRASRVCVGNVVGAGAEIAARLRPARRRRQPQAHVGRAPGWARRSARPGSCRSSGSRGPRTSSSPGASSGWTEAAAIGFLHRTARRRPTPRPPRWPWPPRSPPHDPAGVRALKSMFSELEAMPARIAHENELLVAWQREGTGLPSGGVRR